MPSPLSTTVPLAGCVKLAIESVSRSTSVSLASSAAAVITSGVSSLVETAVVGRHGSVVDRRDRDVDGGGVGAAVAVGDRVGEAVRAVEVGGRRVGERAVAVVHHRAVGRLGEAVDRKRIQVDVRIVGQQRGGGDHQRRVFVGRRRCRRWPPGRR